MTRGVGKPLFPDLREGLTYAGEVTSYTIEFALNEFNFHASRTYSANSDLRITNNKCTDQIARMFRLVCLFAVCMYQSIFLQERQAYTLYTSSVRFTIVAH